ncbi:MAG: ribosome recycling factor [Nitrospinae bacterium]|nr:ribosome recycling factor [Nitrospinota bacterium]
MTMSEIIQDADKRMQGAKSALLKDFDTLRTGRANVSFLDSVKVDYYGTMSPLSSVASLSTPDPRTIAIQPWEKKLVPIIEKAILTSNLGLNPNSDGETIRISIPPLTEERRKELVKVAKKYAEDHKVGVRNIRRDANEKLKRMEKDKEVSEDEGKKRHDEVQVLTDKFINEFDKLLGLKEKEIMQS